MKFDKDIRARLGRLPSKLEQLYLEVYNELVSHEGEVGRCIVDNTLKWLLCARRTMCTSEFLSAVSISLEEDVTKDHILEMCHNFVLYDEQLDIFRFAHLSVREFLEMRPEFSQINCNTLAAKGCLLQLMASSDSFSLGSDETDQRISCVPEAISETEDRNPTQFLEYAQSEWMDHCQLVPRSIRSEGSGLGLLLKSFLVTDSGPSSALDAWVHWFCSRVLSWDARKALWDLQALLLRNRKPKTRSLLIAIYYGFGEVISDVVDDQELEDEVRGKCSRLAAMAHQNEIFDVLSSGESWQLTESVLFYALQSADQDQVVWLLAKADPMSLTVRVAHAVLEREWQCDGQCIALLLEKNPDLIVTHYMLCIAYHGSFEVLLARSNDKIVTQYLLELVVERGWLDELALLLDKAGPRSLTPELCGYVICWGDTKMLELLLERGGNAFVTEESMVAHAAFRPSPQMLEMLLKHGAQLTSKVMIALFENSCSKESLHYALEQSGSTRIDIDLTTSMTFYSLDGELLTMLIDRGGNVTQSSLLAAIPSHAKDEVLLTLLEHGCHVDSQTLIASAAAEALPSRILKILLEHVDKAVLTETMPELVFKVACSPERTSRDLSRKMRLLLDRAPDLEISEYTLLAATCAKNEGSEMVRMFLRQKVIPNITVEMLICAIANLDMDAVTQILARVENVDITYELLEAAAVDPDSGGVLVDLLLEKSHIKTIPDVVLDSALRNDRQGMDIILALEKRLGRINVTEDIMVKIVCAAAQSGWWSSGAEYLFDPMRVTEKAVHAAISTENARWGSPDYDRVIENALHIPITNDILQAAAKNVDMPCFRFLWNHRNGEIVAKVFEDFIVEAAKNWNTEILKFLLDETGVTQIKEDLLLELSVHNYGVQFYNLLDRGRHVQVTERVLEAAISNSSRTEGLVPLLLQNLLGQKITDSMYRAAAIAGSEATLYHLSEFSGLECPPARWLEIARLNDANI